MTPSTLSTILNTAQLIMQNADRLTTIIRKRSLAPDPEPTDTLPESLEDLNNELQRLHQRLDAGDEANVQQLKFIEQLARQNELLAESLQASNRRTQWALIIAAAAATTSLLLIIWVLLT